MIGIFNPSGDEFSDSNKNFMNQERVEIPGHSEKYFSFIEK